MEPIDKDQTKEPVDKDEANNGDALRKHWYLKADIISSALSVVIATAALVYGWQVSTTEREINRVDARIANCTAVASIYLEQAVLYGRPEYDKETGRFQRTNLSKTNEDYANIALKISRAASLCRISEGDLTTCMDKYVNIPEHLVKDKGLDGNEYENPVC